MMETFTKFVWMQKGAYTYECMENWYSFNETLLPDRKELYISQTMKDIIYANYKYTKNSLEDSWIQNLGEYNVL